LGKEHHKVVFFNTRLISAISSSTNNLGTSTSDVDVCLTTDWVDYEHGIQNMNVLGAILRKRKMFFLASGCLFST
jgi:DNA polymerase sigma